MATTNGGVVDDDKFYFGTEQAGITLLGMGGVPELIENRDTYQISELRISRELLWIGDDAFSRALCIGISGTYRGKMYLWDNDGEPGSGWDGKVESAGNIFLLANSFTEFIAGLRPPEQEKKGSGCASVIAAVVVVVSAFVLLLVR